MGKAQLNMYLTIGVGVFFGLVVLVVLIYLLSNIKSRKKQMNFTLPALDEKETKENVNKKKKKNVSLTIKQKDTKKAIEIMQTTAREETDLFEDVVGLLKKNNTMKQRVDLPTLEIEHQPQKEERNIELSKDSFFSLLNELDEDE